MPFELYVLREILNLTFLDIKKCNTIFCFMPIRYKLILQRFDVLWTLLNFFLGRFEGLTDRISLDEKVPVQCCRKVNCSLIIQRLVFLASDDVPHSGTFDKHLAYSIGFAGSNKDQYNLLKVTDRFQSILGDFASISFLRLKYELALLSTVVVTMARDVDHLGSEPYYFLEVSKSTVHSLKLNMHLTLLDHILDLL